MTALRRFFVCLFVLLFALNGSVAQTNKKINDLKSQKSSLQKKISKNETSLKSTQQSVKKRMSELAILNGQIEAQEDSIARLQRQIDSLARKTRELEEELADLRRELADKKQRYRRSMLYLYNNRKAQNKLLFILSADGFSQMLRRYRYVKEYAKYQKAAGLIIQKKEQQVKDTEEALRRDKANRQEALRVQEKKQAELTASQAAQQKMVKSLRSQQKQIESVLKQDRKTMAELDKKIDYYVQKAIEEERKRREEEARKKAAEEAARQKSQANKGKDKTKADPMGEYKVDEKEYALSQDFASNKGRLPVPITGAYTISAHYGSYNVKGLSGVQLDNKGINLTSRSSCQARAIFDGEVSVIFPLGGLMNVLVRHGSYISVYCNLSSVSVRKGQKVTTRQSIGQVAKDASGNYTLHFQLRKEKAVLNPESWLAR